MTVRSILIIGTAAALCAVLAACAGSGETSPEIDPAPVEAGVETPTPEEGDESGAPPDAEPSGPRWGTPVGWAAQPLEREGEMHPAVTGGAAGETVTADDADTLAEHLAAEEPLVVEVSGRIELDGAVRVGSDKTLIAAAEETAELVGGRLVVEEAANVVISDLTLDADGAAVSVRGGSHHVWIDGNTLRGGGDEALISITDGADHVTVSWNHFRDSEAALGVGGREDGPDPMRVSVHHNLFEGVDTRNPRARGAARAHVFNNFYRGAAGHGVESGYGAAVLVEGNYFDGVGISVTVDPEVPGSAFTRDNLLVDTGQPELFGTVDDPPYAYELDDTADVPDIVTATAGAGR
ncbi:pectate lyase [Nocardiopsis sp. N85]|uniref:pectate lyase family protein n=1 Tax=Nocardiopsis sp. N85 TaxID=3029400 RepID=UPI00237F526D|nr:pectate lyase [Nocardiopsis sp. N85]MDE3719885.1 pectate lyase [Nocardiopsis sp. N85]